MTWHFYSTHTHAQRKREKERLAMYRIEEAVYKIWYIAFLFLVSQLTFIEDSNQKGENSLSLSLSYWARYLSVLDCARMQTLSLSLYLSLSFSYWAQYLGWTCARLCPHADSLSVCLSLSHWVRYLGWTCARLCPHADGRRFDPHIWQHTFVEISHHSETISTVMYWRKNVD